MKQRYCTSWMSLLLAGALVVPALAAQERIDDAEITAAIVSEVMADDSVAAHKIDVETRRGVVTLTGSVSNLLAKETATRVAENIKGVLAVVNRIEVQPVEVSDRQLVKDVQTALLADPATDSYEVEVSAEDGVVTLTGSVDSFKERGLCVNVAKSIRGVKTVENRIKVYYEYERPDAEIGPEVRALLDMDVRVDAEAISVDVEDGFVNLSGVVGSAAEKSLAQSIAHVAGVKEVNAENLNVEWWARDEMLRRSTLVPASDQEVAEAVHRALRQDPRVWSFDVRVVAVNGTVTLSGVVDNAEAKQAAETDARNTVGVWRVRNLLQVRPVKPVNDERLVDAIESRLRLDPYVDRYDITVASYDGRVYLYGSVDSDFERKRAGAIARSINGPTDVHNSIVVDRPWAHKGDWELEQDIHDQFFWSPFLDEEAIEVDVENGVATLTGEVDSWRAYRLAAANAFEGGAREVVNHIEVE